MFIFVGISFLFVEDGWGFVPFIFSFLYSVGDRHMEMSSFFDAKRIV